MILARRAWPSANASGAATVPLTPSRVLALGVAALGLLITGIVIGAMDWFLMRALTGGLIVGGVVLVRPIVGIVLLVFAVPFGGLVRVGAGELTFGAAEGIFGLLLVAWLARAVRHHRLSVPRGALAVALLLLTALAMFSITYALDRGSAVKETLKWLELLLVMAIVADVAYERDSVVVVLTALFAAGTAEALSGAMQVLTGGGPAAFALAGSLRAYGHFEQPNPFAGYLSTILPVAIAMLLCPVAPPRLRKVALVASVSMAGGIALSQSRGAWLGALAAGAFMMFIWSARTRRLLVPASAGAIAVGVLAMVGLLPAAIVDRLSQLVSYFGIFDVRSVELTPENWAVVERMAHWQAGWLMFLASPWMGVGAGNYPAAYGNYFLPQWPNPLGHAHNYYLNMLAELGVVGLGMLMLVLGVAFGTLLRGFGPTRYGERLFWRALLAGVLGSLAVLCVHNLFDNLFVHSVNMQMGVLLGLGVIATEHLKRPAGLGVIDARSR